MEKTGQHHLQVDMTETSQKESSADPETESQLSPAVVGEHDQASRGSTPEEKFNSNDTELPIEDEKTENKKLPRLVSKIDESTSGSESDNEDERFTPHQHRRRLSGFDLPETVTALKTEQGSKVFIVGTAHFSESSMQDVVTTIRTVQPDVVVVELCKSRVNILQLDEKTLLEEAKNINIEKMRLAIKQSGLLQGILHLLLLSMSAHLTKQLGMAPGGEFRKAFREAQKVPACKLHLGDRPIQITLQRALASLSFWQKCRLAWYVLTSRDPISKEEVEKCKQKDLLEEMLEEMTGEFPALSRVFVTERDAYLAHSLRNAALAIPCCYSQTGYMPAIVVGVVGIGHVPGIVENWDKNVDIKALLEIPRGSRLTSFLRWSFRSTVICLTAYGVYKVLHRNGIIGEIQIHWPNVDIPWVK